MFKRLRRPALARLRGLRGGGRSVPSPSGDRFWLEYTPALPALRAFHLSPARVRLLIAGRRFGKTTAAAGEIARLALARPCRGWIVAPILAQCRECFEAVRRIIPSALVAAERRAPAMELVLTNGSRIEARSAQWPAHLRGAGLDWLVIDEAAHVREEAWRAVYPATSDRQGRIILLSTPYGRNWLYREWRRAESRGPDYAGWLFRSNASPYFPAAEWDRARSVMPAEHFRQEYEAEFLDDTLALFHDWRDCRMKGEAGKPPPRALAGPEDAAELRHRGKQTCIAHVLGVDLGKDADWTVACVLRPRRDAQADWYELVALERFQHLAWTKQWERLEQILRDFPGRFFVDETGVGSPTVDYMRRRIPGAVVGRKFTPLTRAALIEGLQLAIESRAVRWPECAGTVVLERELDEFRYRRRGARLVPEAPPGGHDDCVFALALAVWGAQYGGRMERW